MKWSEFEALRPKWIADLFQRVSLWSGIDWRRVDYANFDEDGREPAKSLIAAEAVGSKIRDDFHYRPGQHYIMLDLDVPVWVVPSSTEGHSHLYIDRIATEDQYFRLLDVLQEIGVLQEGYVAASKQRGETFLRLPWIRKGHEKEDVALTAEEYLSYAPKPDELPF